MSQPKILTVIGATGQQGGSVVRYVSQHPRLAREFKIRAVTRDPSKAAFPDGIEVVQANLNEVESLKQVFKGSHTVFAATNYWEQCDKQFEQQQGINVADAAKAVGVRHLIWSGSTNVAKVTEGKISNCEYFDNKAEVMEHIEKIKGDMVATYPAPAVFMQTIKSEMRREGDGRLVWAKPWDEHKTRVPLIDANDTGAWVAGIMLQPLDKVNGVKLLGTASWMSPKQVLEDLSEVLGETVSFREITADDWHASLPTALPQAAKAALTDNMVWMRDYGYFGPGAEDEQKESDKILGEYNVKSWRDFVLNSGIW